MITIKCKNCRKEIQKYPSQIKSAKNGVFCNKTCWYEYKAKNGNKVKCNNCGIIFFKNPSKVGRGRDFCSLQCKHSFRKGKTFKEFVGKEKAKKWLSGLSKAKKGKTHIEIFGEEEAKRKLKTLKEKVHPLKIGRPRLDVRERWKRLRTPYNYNITSKELQKLRKHGQYKTWRKQVLERDKVCVKCGSDKNLQVDHIIPIFENRHKMLDLENGQVLCMKCHRKKTNEELKRWYEQEKVHMQQ